MYEKLINVYQANPIEDIINGKRKIAFAVFISENIGYQIYVDRRKELPVVEVVSNMTFPNEFVNEVEASITASDNKDATIMNLLTQFAIPYATTKLESYLSDKKVVFALYHINEDEQRVWLYDSLISAKKAFECRVRNAKALIREEEAEYGEDESKPYEITNDSEYTFTYGTSDGCFVESDLVRIKVIQ